MFLFSGIFFPLGQMPEAVRGFAQVLPLTHVVELARALVRGRVGADLLAHFGVVVALLAAAYAVCARAMQRRLTR
jgi:lipooligosaccharide transport system permease protein